jgi:DNA-binding MurR/RpiR family transcriptional regulator
MKDALRQRIAECYDNLPRQLRLAARHVLDHPDDVALKSMRDLARAAGLPPATMTRLARALGLPSYAALRAAHADALRTDGVGFASGASRQMTAGDGDGALIAGMVATARAQIERLAAPDTVAALTAAADMLAAARRIHCIGLRSSRVVAGHFVHILSFVGDRAVLIDGAPGGGFEAIRFAGENDAVLAVSVAPYTRTAIDVAQYAKRCGVPLVCITDSAVSPLARLADRCVLVTTESPAFLHGMTPALLAGEMLGALVAGRGGTQAVAAIDAAERTLVDLDILWSPPPRTRKTQA